MYSYQKGDFETIIQTNRKDALRLAKLKSFNGHLDSRSVQENFNLIASFKIQLISISSQQSSRSVSLIPWINPEIRRKIRKRNKIHVKVKKTGSGKLWTKFETLSREIKADIKKQHDLYVNNLVGDVKASFVQR